MMREATCHVMGGYVRAVEDLDLGQLQDACKLRKMMNNGIPGDLLDIHRSGLFERYSSRDCVGILSWKGEKNKNHTIIHTYLDIS